MTPVILNHLEAPSPNTATLGSYGFNVLFGGGGYKDSVHNTRYPSVPCRGFGKASKNCHSLLVDLSTSPVL